MFFTASVAYIQGFTHNTYCYSSSVMLLSDCKRLTTETQHRSSRGWKKEVGRILECLKVRQKKVSEGGHVEERSKARVDDGKIKGDCRLPREGEGKKVRSNDSEWKEEWLVIVTIMVGLGLKTKGMRKE